MTKRLKKDIGVPNLQKQKAKLMRQAEQHKIIQEVRRNPALSELEYPTLMKSQQQKEIHEMIRDAEENANLFYETKSSNLDTGESALPSQKLTKAIKNNRKQFYHILRKVVNASDIVLEVLDARDPNGTRSIALEQEVQKMGKQLILVINKIDLVPQQVSAGWVEYLKQFHPTVTFKATTSTSSSSMVSKYIHDQQTQDGTDEASKMINISHGDSFGSQNLLSLCKTIVKTGHAGHMMRTHVGVVGFPNVGKSSIINTLKRSKAVKTSSDPGCTRSMQTVEVESKIAIIDSPGVVFVEDKGQANSALTSILRGHAKPDEIDDPVTTLTMLLEVVHVPSLYALYPLPNTLNTSSASAFAADFTRFIARHFGKLTAGGIEKLEDGARIVLRDWRDGKIPFWHQPPDNIVRPVFGGVGDAVIVPQFSDRFVFGDEGEEEGGEADDGSAVVLGEMQRDVSSGEAGQVDDVEITATDLEEEEETLEPEIPPTNPEEEGWSSTRNRASITINKRTTHSGNIYSFLPEE
ncbi:putative GTPase grn1 [Blattamonas nauphoetae]|uniref:GTPase grn1 n=1 Tax=Blattamonas nauphoetae TaxID=2049346 RepID=A0ABQ9XQ47_9EUKA|nr:putative GTPase grn1 [Blattamonas nauphoetae]